MKISFQWLCEFVPELKKVDPRELARLFTLKSFEVEEIFEEKTAFEHMVAGRINKIRRHPNADKLVLVDTDVGKKRRRSSADAPISKKDNLFSRRFPGQW